MSLWTWLLAGLCAAGALLALVSIIRVALSARRLSMRIERLGRSRLFTSLQSLALQMDRLSRLSTAVTPLEARAQTAATSIRDSLQALQLAEARRALASVGAEIRALFAALR